MKNLAGALNLNEAAMKEGARIAGILSTKVNESRGGFFRGGRSRGPRR